MGSQATQDSSRVASSKSQRQSPPLQDSISLVIHQGSLFGEFALQTEETWQHQIREDVARRHSEEDVFAPSVVFQTKPIPRAPTPVQLHR
jgi:hypothetical protein